MVKVTSLLVKAGSGVGFSFGGRARTEMEIWCVKGMFRLNLISSEKNSGFIGLKVCGWGWEVLCNKELSKGETHVHLQWVKAHIIHMVLVLALTG